MDQEWLDLALQQEELFQDDDWESLAKWASVPTGEAVVTPQKPATSATPAQSGDQTGQPVTYQPRLHTSMPPQETPAMKKRRLIEKQPPSLVASSATSSSPESTFSAVSRLPIVQFKRPASRKGQGCTRPGAADTSEVPADAGDAEILDWRSELQKKVDYDTTVKLGKRLHNKDIAGNHSGKSGKERKKTNQGRLEQAQRCRQARRVRTRRG
jgi:hypothetical protein